MTSMADGFLSWSVLIFFLNAAMASLLACGFAVILSRQPAWSLPARHALLVVSLGASLIVPLFSPLTRFPSLWAMNTAATENRSAPVILQPLKPPTGEIVRPEIPPESPVGPPPAAISPRSDRPIDLAASKIESKPPSTSGAAPSRARSNATVAARVRGIGSLLCAVWMLGTAFRLIWAIIAVAGLRRWIQSVTIATSPALADIARLAATNVGWRSKVNIYHSRLLPAPVTCGLWQPRIVLPVGLETTLSADQLRAVIQHELAHLARRDLWVGLLQHAAAIAYWWNPLVLLANRRLAEVREQICDDIAIRELPEAQTYATTLILLAERCAQSQPVPATLGIGLSSAGQLERRIRRILSSSESRGIRVTRRAAVLISAAMLLMTATILVAQVQVESPAKNPAARIAPAVSEQPALTKSPQPTIPQPPVSAVTAPQAVGDSVTVAEEPDPFDTHPEWGRVEVPGRVVGPDGKPVAGATVFLRKFGVRVPSKKGTTDADGQFTFTTYRRNGPKLTAENPNPVVTTKVLPGGITVTITETNQFVGAPHTDESEIGGLKGYIAASAPGFGFGTLAPGEGVTVKLVADEPITGRITDDEGRPVAGARVRVRNVFWPRRADDPIVRMEDRRGRNPAPAVPEGEGLDPWMAAVGRAVNMNEYYVAMGSLIGLIEHGMLGDKPAVHAPLIPPVKTDSDGRFSLHGIGRERVAELYIDGVPDKSSALIVVANRKLDKPILVPSQSPSVKQFITDAAVDLAIFGNHVELALAPGRTLEGVVSDRETGAPLAGWQVVGPTITRLEYPGFDRFFATTDDQGRYRIDNFPVMARAYFKVEAPEKWLRRRASKEQEFEAQPHFGREMYLAVKPGTGPQQVDFPLSKGVWITGKVVDDVTGEGLYGQSIEYHVFNDNPFLKQDLARRFMPEFDDNLHTNSDGTFRLRAYPGRGIVTAGGGHGYLEGVGADEIAGLKDDEYSDSLYNTGGFSPYIRNTTVEVNVPDQAKSFTCELRLKNGKSRLVTVLDLDDNPVADLQASGIDNQIQNPIRDVANSFFTVTSLFPGERREVVARCVPRKLMGMAVVTDEDDVPVTLKLQPWANLIGRLVDDAGKPRFQGLRIQLEDGKLPIHTLNGLNYDKQEFLIDATGKFHIDGLVPGATYRLQVVEGGVLHLGDATEDFTLKPGETRDLGDVKVLTSKESR